MQKLNIIYLVGIGRSGSTILDRILGSMDGIKSFNEIYRLWEEGFIDNNLCACGNRFRDCSFWENVIRNTFNESIDDIDIDSILKLHHSFDHSKHVPFMILGLLWKKKKEELDEYQNILRKLYFSIAEKANTDIIVDSSKVPSRALLLNNIPEFNVNIIHLVRDPRAVVYAWNKEKFDPAKNKLLKRDKKSARAWIIRNILSEVILTKIPGITVKYEDFAKYPKQTFNFIINSTSILKGKNNPFITETEVELPILHSMGGNPDRFKTGITKIKYDDEWRYKISKRSKITTDILTFFLRMKYKY